MKMRSLTVFITSLTLLGVVLTGCGTDVPQNEISKGSEIVEEVTAQDEEAQENSVGMANPMVEIGSDKEYLDQLGFSMDTSCLPQDNLERFIIGGQLAHAAFDVTDTEGNPVKCVLRGTTDVESSQDPIELIAGVYADDFDEVTTVFVPTEKGNIEFKSVYSKAEKITVSFWNYEGVNFTFTVNGEISQMQMSALDDSVMCAIGAKIVSAGSKYIVPLPESLDIENIDDVMFNASIENITEADGITTADITLYSMDLYDVVDISTMSNGDVINISGEDIEITEITEGNPVDFHDDQGPRNVILINGGFEEGGAELIGYEGGTYRVFGLDDHATYSELGRVNLEIAKDCLISDTSDLEQPDGITLTTADLITLNDKEFDPGFNLLNTRVRIVDNKVIEINRWFIP